MCLINLAVLFCRYITRVRNRSSSTVSKERKRQRLSCWPHGTRARETQVRHRRGSVFNRPRSEYGGSRSVGQQRLLAFAAVSAAATAGERQNALRVFNFLLTGSSSESPLEFLSVASGCDDHALMRLEAARHGNSEQVARTCRGYLRCLSSRRGREGETGLGKRSVPIKACPLKARNDGGECRVEFCVPIRMDHLKS